MLHFSEFQKKTIAETVIPRNTHGGFLGTAGNEAHTLLDHAVALIKKATKGIAALKFSDIVISHYLDSRGGRQLAELLLDKQPDDVVMTSIKKSIDSFVRSYNPGLFEETYDGWDDGMGDSDGQVIDEDDSSPGTGGIFSSNPVRHGRAVGHLRRLMRQPLKAHEAHEKVKPHAHDVRLLNDIKHFAGKDPHVDVRPLVKKRMRELKISGF
jgi:hypothetical protein